MANVLLSFKKRAMMYYSAKVIIDGGAPITIANDTSANIELSEGTHTISACLPMQGNDTYLANAEFVVKPNMQYEVIYALEAISTSGILTIKEISPGGYGLNEDGKRTNVQGGVTVTKTKKRINIFVIILFAFVIVMVAVSLIMSFRFSPSDLTSTIDEMQKHNTQTVTALNAPCEMSGFKVTAAEIETVKPEYQEKDELLLNVKFVIENVSSQPVYVASTSLKAYVDDVAVDEYYGSDKEPIKHGDLDAGKSTQGYYCISIPKDAKHVEIIMPLGLYEKDSITFSFDVPPLEEK